MDNWEINIGLNKFEPPLIKEEAIKFINLDSQSRSKLSCEECAEAVVILAQYAAYVSRASQQQEAEAYLLKEKVQELIGENMATKKAYSPDERKALALAEDEKASEYDLLRIAAMTKAKRLYMYAERIDKLSRAYEVLSNSKKRGRQYGD